MKNDQNTNIEELKELIRKFCEERNWSKRLSPKDLSEAIIIEAAELLEHVLWKTTEETKNLLQDRENKGKLAEELADIIIYCLNFADVTNIDIAQAVIDKIRKNGEKYPAVQD